MAKLWWPVLSLFVLSMPMAASTFEHKVVAAVLMAEAWSDGKHGMLAVGEVIRERARLRKRTPLEVVTERRAFSCLNRTTPRALVAKFESLADFAWALDTARTVVDHPGRLPGIARGATHFVRRGHPARWTRGQRPVLTTRHHVFYALK